MESAAKLFLKLAATAFVCSLAVVLVFAAVALVTDPGHVPRSFRAIPRWLEMPAWAGVALVTTPLVLAAFGAFLRILAGIWRD